MNNLATEYDRDFNAWIQQQITLLKQGRVNEINSDKEVSWLSNIIIL